MDCPELLSTLHVRLGDPPGAQAERFGQLLVGPALFALVVRLGSIVIAMQSRAFDSQQVITAGSTAFVSYPQLLKDETARTQDVVFFGVRIDGYVGLLGAAATSLPPILSQTRVPQYLFNRFER